MERIYEKALSKLGLTQEAFDSIVFADANVEDKIVECLEYCFENVESLEFISCILLQYIAERTSKIRSKKKTAENVENGQKYIDKREKYDIIDMRESDTHDDGNSAVAYAIAKKMGIDTEGMEPKEVWEAINKEGGTGSKSTKKSPPRIVSATAAEKDHVFGSGFSDKAQQVYDKMRKNEKKITRDCVKIAKSAGVELSGLDFSVKTASSVADKVERAQKELAKDGKTVSDDAIIADMWDVVRYTGIGKHEDLVKHTNDVMDAFERSGYQIVECVNKYTIPDTSYKGIHLAVKSPDGQMFEYQIHSEESLRVKNINHKLYEEERNVRTTPERKAELKKEMKKNTESIPMPKDIDKLETFREGRRRR